jgi:hypothetical protein
MIKDYTYSELPPLLIPEKLRDKKEVTDDPDSIRIPLLRDLFNEFPQYPMQIDVKEGCEEMVVCGIAKIHARGCLSTRICTFNIATYPFPLCPFTSTTGQSWQDD